MSGVGVAAHDPKGINAEDVGIDHPETASEWSPGSSMMHQ